MNLTAWLTALLSVGHLHADAAQLRAAAIQERVPPIVMEGVAGVETGYKGGNDYRGADGELGRMQVQAATARAAHCDEPLALEDYQHNIVCGARILRWCRDRNHDWPTAIRCYQGAAVPPSTSEYLAKVEREIGRQQLARLR